MPTFNNPSNILTLYIILTTIITWLSIIIWTLRDIQSRTRNNITKTTAVLTTTLIPIPGIIIYLILRPKETLTEAYERSLEEEALLQQIEQTETCPGCGHNIATNWQICTQCHTRLKRPCQNCKNLLEITWDICPYCTTPQNNYKTTSTNQQPETHNISTYYKQQPNLQFIDDEE